MEARFLTRRSVRRICVCIVILIQVDANSGAVIFSTRLTDRDLEEIAFSPDGQSVVAGCATGTLYMVNANSGEIIFSKRLSHDRHWMDTVYSIAYTSDGLRLIAGNREVDRWYTFKVNVNSWAIISTPWSSIMVMQHGHPSWASLCKTTKIDDSCRDSRCSMVKPYNCY